MSEQPTGAQRKEFWERYGLRMLYETADLSIWLDSGNEVVHAHSNNPPPIDLNSLFRYAVPKVSNYNMCKGLEPGKPVFGQHIAEVWSLTNGYGKAYSEDPALALFWALWQVRGKETAKEE